MQIFSKKQNTPLFGETLDWGPQRGMQMLQDVRYHCNGECTEWSSIFALEKKKINALVNWGRVSPHVCMLVVGQVTLLDSSAMQIFFMCFDDWRPWNNVRSNWKDEPLVLSAESFSHDLISRFFFFTLKKLHSENFTELSRVTLYQTIFLTWPYCNL